MITDCRRTGAGSPLVVALLTALVFLPVVVGCGSSGPVQTGQLEMGGDSGQPARIDTNKRKLSGVESGDTVMYFPSNGRQKAEPSNPVIFRFYEERNLDNETERGVASLVITHTVSHDGGKSYSRNHLVNVGNVDKNKPMKGKLRFAVTNVGTERIPTFLIVHELPDGFSIPKSAKLEIDADETAAEWEVDKQGRVLIREPKPIKPATTRTYTLDMEIDVPR